MSFNAYIGFGLRWMSDVCLPDLPDANDCEPPDVHLRVKSWPSGVSEDRDAVLWYASPPRADGSWIRVFHLVGDEFFLVRYGDGTDFLIHQSGSKLWCRWRPEYSFDYAATYLYGPILGFLLRLRGVVCLHASVVVIDDWAVAFMGPAGSGKSTLAAAMAKRGFPVTSDDILALTESEGVFKAVPTYPRLRLWPDSVDALFGSSEALPHITQGWDKRYFELNRDREFETRSRPLGAIYVLGERSDEGAGQAIKILGGTAALRSLIANTYAFKTFDHEMRRREFGLLSRLVRQMPLRLMAPSADLARVGELCKWVVRDFRTLPHLNPLTVTGVHPHV